MPKLLHVLTKNALDPGLRIKYATCRLHHCQDVPLSLAMQTSEVHLKRRHLKLMSVSVHACKIHL